MKLRIFLALLLLGAAAFFAWQAYQAREQLAWKSTAGSVNNVWTQTIVGPPRPSLFPGSNFPRYVHRTWLSYSYEVNGKTYFAKGLGSRGDSQGRIIRIYYDPDHPERSTNDQPADSILLPVLAILLFAGAAAVGLGRRDRSARTGRHRAQQH
ncbi:MAG TPA: DUF3592 domain-containing protein [Thermoanaerobaculia bacterium]|nr:DUF3592 domain-containing protein [Thermoanaerobaculia bacterium]